MGRHVSQIIDGDYTFNDDTKEEFRRWGFYNRGFDYNIVSILGSQSGGKSTLLNMLFGTSFQEMDAEGGRSQTTLGMWASYDDVTNSVVMDVEGTDSKERGDEHMNFERKSALFSLALAEVLLVNMWCSDIGRYTASNYGTLKIVMELHLELFPAKTGVKTLLLFVLRDHTQKTTLAQLSATLTRDVEKIWSDIQKPEAYKNVPLGELFDLDFSSLPHKELQEDKFVTEVTNLRKRFADKARDDYLFKDGYNKQIPADGLVAYAENIWDTIRGNKDLDIPTQKEIMSMYRCDEILEEATSLLSTTLEGIAAEIQAGSMKTSPTDLLKEAAHASMTLFDDSAKRYVDSVYRTRHDMLTERIFTKCRELFVLHLENEAKTSMKDAIDLAFAQAKDSMWSDLSATLRTHLANVTGDVDSFAHDFAMDEAAKVDLHKALCLHGKSIIHARLVEENRFILVKLKQVFEKDFKFDKNRVPRMWGKDDNVSDIFTGAKEEAMRVLGLFANLKLEPLPHDVSPAKEDMVTSGKREQELRDQFEQDVAPLYHEAVEQQRRQLAMTGVPPWVYILIMVLGFNEVMLVLTNPLLLILVLLVAGGGYLVHAMNLSGPALAMVMNMVERARLALAQSLESVQEHQRQQQQQQSENPAVKKEE